MANRHTTGPRGYGDRLAGEAARMMAEQGIGDPLDARRKAAIRLGLTDIHDLPSGEEILAALRDYLELFHAESHRQRMLRLRGVARTFMRRLAALADVRLVGPVLDGSAVVATPVTLHLLGVTAEEVAIHLLETGIGFRESSRTVSYGPQDHREMPAFILRHADCDVEVLVFGPDAPRQPPLSPVTGRAQKRANLDTVCDLLGE